MKTGGTIGRENMNYTAPRIIAELITAGYFFEYKIGANMTNQKVRTVVKKSIRIFTIVDQEGDLIIYSNKVGDEVVTFGGNIT